MDSSIIEGKEIDSKSVSFAQDMDLAISVMRDAGKWMLETGKNPSKWWQLQNLNRDFLLQHAKEDEFYVCLVDGTPAAAEILQLSQDVKEWQTIDKDNPQRALHIHWLCVARELAGRGLPKVMVDYAAQKAKEQNVTLLRIDTNADEMKLRKIYESLGFQLVAEIQEDYRRTAFYQKRVL